MTIELNRYGRYVKFELLVTMSTPWPSPWLNKEVACQRWDGPANMCMMGPPLEARMIPVESKKIPPWAYNNFKSGWFHSMSK